MCIAYRNPRKDTAARVPYLLDVQSDFLQALDTRVVMDTPQIVGYPWQALKAVVANLDDQAFEIQNALDFLFAGI